MADETRLKGNPNEMFACIKKLDRFFSGIKELTVKVLGDPMVTVTPVTALVTEGSDVTFTCSAAASSTALTYKWEKNRAVIAGETDHRLQLFLYFQFARGVIDNVLIFRFVSQSSPGER